MDQEYILENIYDNNHFTPDAVPGPAEYGGGETSSDALLPQVDNATRLYKSPHKVFSALCSFHNREKYNMYCRDCDKPICCYCAQHECRYHNTVVDMRKLKEIFEEKKDVLKKGVAAVEVAVSQPQQRGFGKISSDENVKINQLTKNVKQQFATLKKMLKAKEKNMIDDIAKCHDNLNKREQLLQGAKGVINEANMLQKSSGKSFAFVQEANEVFDRLQKTEHFLLLKESNTIFSPSFEDVQQAIGELEILEIPGKVQILKDNYQVHSKKISPKEEIKWTPPFNKVNCRNLEYEIQLDSGNAWQELLTTNKPYFTFDPKKMETESLRHFDGKFSIRVVPKIKISTDKSIRNNSEEVFYGLPSDSTSVEIL
ncbi:unnamed protein product [Owenia fusiformis]|uniref:Uncharacterized protein n=1 Tax=Owenia fusiformis TaxID=6347 RepID=A0A8J1XR73_OWEFU|nr:unnamed protein product [Owenia fusiformis]